MTVVLITVPCMAIASEREGQRKLISGPNILPADFMINYNTWAQYF